MTITTLYRPGADGNERIHLVPGLEHVPEDYLQEIHRVGLRVVDEDVYNPLLQSVRARIWFEALSDSDVHQGLSAIEWDTLFTDAYKIDQDAFDKATNALGVKIR